MPNCYPPNLKVSCLVCTAATLYCFTYTDLIALVAISVARYVNIVQKGPAN